MGQATLRALVIATNISTFGVPAIVTRPAPDDTPIPTTGIWLTPQTEDRPLRSAEFSRRDVRRVMAFAKADVPTCPKGTRIEAPDEQEGTASMWLVEGTDIVETEHVRVVVVPAGE